MPGIDNRIVVIGGGLAGIASACDLADACLDTDPEVHRMLTEKLFPQWADVLAVADWLKAIAPR